MPRIKQSTSGPAHIPRRTIPSTFIAAPVIIPRPPINRSIRGPRRVPPRPVLEAHAIIPRRRRIRIHPRIRHHHSARAA